MNMQDVLTDFLLKEFKSELNRSGSPLNKKYKAQLQKMFNSKSGISNKTVKQALSGGDDDKHMRGKNGKAVPEYSEDIYNEYKRGTGSVVLDNLISGAGDVAEGGGNIYNAYQSLLGDALLAVSQGMTSQGYDNPLFMAPATAAAMKIKGAAAGIGGSTLNKIAKNIVNDRRGTDEQNRNLRTMMEFAPPGSYYDAQGRAQKFGGQYDRK